jgi:hypothetical protein
MNTTELRLSSLTNNLDLLYKKLGEFEEELIISCSIDQKFAIRQKIEKKIIPDIRKYEQEYWKIYPIDAIIISEEEATTELTQVQQAIDKIQYSNGGNYPQKFLDLLEDIQTKLNDLDKVAAAKLKVVLPLIPMIASYELEIDTESLIYKTLESIRGLVKKKR